MGHGRRDSDQTEWDLSADHVDNRRTSAAVWDVNDVDVGKLLD
jgi:hypothetical protein